MKKYLPVLLLILILSIVLLNGCGIIGGNAPPPKIEEYQTIAIAPLATVEATADMSRRIALDLGTRLELRLKDTNTKLIYDQSETLNPIGKKLAENNATSNDLFTDPKLAARIGKDLVADIIIIGSVRKPTLKLNDSDKQYERMGTASMGGSKRYTLWKQTATIDAKFKIVDTKSGQLIWNGSVKGATKYIKAFQAQTPERNPVPDNVVIANLRDHLVDRIAHALYPTYPDRELPELLMKPDVELMDSGGNIVYEKF
jgi:hypothetical protein